MATTKISRTSSSTGNRRTWTFSGWFKKCSLAVMGGLFATYTDSNNRLDFGFDASDKFFFKEKVSSSTNIDFTSTQTFRDVSAFYHLVISVDTTQSTNTNRVKIYINGEQITSWVDSTYPAEDYDTLMNLTGRTYILGSKTGSADYWNGLMAHVHLVDGTALTPATFGETDSTSGIWKPKTAPSVTYGTNGFFLKFENSGNMDLDSSGNNLTFTTSGTLTQNVDTPSNNFVTMNPLDNYYNSSTFTNGNTTVTTPSSGYSGVIGAMGASKGKWYFEFKPVSKTGDADEYSVGIAGASVTATNQPHYKLATGYMYLGSNGNSYNNDSGSSYGNTFTAGDIIGVAMDLDNSKLYFSKNGTFQNSGVPTSGSTGTGAISITAPDSTPIGFYLPCCAFSSNSAGATMSFNFGSGYFGTTAVASANADANGHGAMEYAVPSGYYTLNTKNLKEFG